MFPATIRSLKKSRPGLSERLFICLN